MDTTVSLFYKIKRDSRVVFLLKKYCLNNFLHVKLLVCHCFKREYF